MGHVSFDLIDIGGVGDYIALPCYREVARGNRRLARLHWDEDIPPKLRKAKTFWVGPIDLCIPFHYRREVWQETEARVQMSGTVPGTTLDRLLRQALLLKLLHLPPLHKQLPRVRMDGQVQ